MRQGEVTEAVMRLASLGVRHFPRPRCFMTSHEGLVGYVVHEYVPPSRLMTIDYGNDGGWPRVVVCASSATWAQVAAHNLANAYRPEGVR